jgi:hypothetical protein
MATDEKSEEQRHYEHLTRYFKYLFTISMAAIALVAGVAIFFTYQNVSDARQEVTKNLSEINNNVSDATEKSLRSIENLQLKAKEEVQNFKQEMRNFALNETKLKVSEAFEENKIAKLVEQTAEQKLKKKLEEIVEEQVIKTQKIIENQMKVIPSLFLAVDKIRQGERSGLTLLDSLRFKDEDPLIRKLANDAFTEKAKDYEESYKSDIDNKTIKKYLQEFRLGPNISVNDTVSVMRGVLNIIQTDQDLYNVAHAILFLNKITGEEFNMFDFESINKWADIYFKSK